MIDPTKIKPSLVEASRLIGPNTRERILANFLNALLADDEAMTRMKRVARAPGDANMRAAIIAAVTEDK